MYKEQLVLIGAGGHCKVIIESINTEKYCIKGILDNFVPAGSYVCGIPVLGTDEEAPGIYASGTSLAVIALVGNLKIRKKIINHYQKIGYQFPNVIHKSCRISPSAQIGAGLTILANACINAEARLDDFVTVNTGAVIEHETTVGCNSHIAPRAVLLGASQIGKNTMVGSGAIVLQQVHIGDDCVIGAGSIVLKDVNNRKTVCGNPAKEIMKDQK